MASNGTKSTQRQINCHIRWMIRRDMEAVLEIEGQCFEYPWSEDDYIKCLRNRNVIGMVAESSERIVGFMIYELSKHKLQILNFGTHEDYRYKGVARSMVNKLVGKLSYDRRTKLCTLIRETNLDAQLAFKAMGFKCVHTHREYETTGEDAYEFVYRLSLEANRNGK